MLTGYKATNPRRPNLDIRDQTLHLIIDLRAESAEDARALANLRTRMSTAMARDRKVTRVDVEFEKESEGR